MKITCPSMSRHDLVRLGVCPLSVDLLFLCVCVFVCVLVMEQPDVSM